ncbi:Mth938-like domain-containing protein [Ferrovibrio xuzhouensis]|uniref:Mth938-like domain-containing protein n=1 Tax=Ferrovibrio xuzhouensis TaxID=1576914 RepID=A0ABV7VK04_9PROT
MDLLPRIPVDRQVINAYGDGGFRINGQRWEQPILIFPGLTVAWAVDGFAGMTVESLQPVFDADPAVELLLVGCGPSIAFLPKDIRAAVRERGVVMEALDTGAACRTYNLLMGESRRVAAALIPV